MVLCPSNPWLTFQERFKKKQMQVTLSESGHRVSHFHTLALAMLTQCNATVTLLSDADFREQSPPPIINLSQTLNSSGQ
jgi:hypothetical protein